MTSVRFLAVSPDRGHQGVVPNSWYTKLIGERPPPYRSVQNWGRLSWHGGHANRARTPRTALHAFYCRWDKPQQQHQKALLRAEVQERLAPGLRQLLALDDPLNDELAGQAGPRSGFLGRVEPGGASPGKPSR
jgi:hypothetical protein